MSLFKKISETVSKGVSTATEKAQQTVEVTRLNSQISGKRKDIDKLYRQIGEAVFEAYQAGDPKLAEAKTAQPCEEIVGILKEIEALDQRVMELRNEKECQCGKRVPFETRFCPSCGHRFPEPVVPAPEPSVATLPEMAVKPDSVQEQETAERLVERHEDDLEESREDEAYAVDPEAMVTCAGCGRQLEAAAAFCPSCGHPQSRH